MKRVLLLVTLLCALPVAAHAAAVTIVPQNQHGDTIWYEGGKNTMNQAWKTAYVNIMANVSTDTNLMAYQIYLRYPSAKIQPFVDSITAGAMLNTADSWFFNVAIDSNATSGTIVITGSRMDATTAEKALNGDGLVLATKICFYRVSTATLFGDSLSISGGSLKFRDATNGAISTVSVQPSGWNFQSKPMWDVDLSGEVNATDLIRVRNNQGMSNWTYDVDETGEVNATDLIQTRNKQGLVSY